MITVAPRLPGQSSSTLLLLVHARRNLEVHMLDVWLQSRLVCGRRDRSTLDLEINFFSSLTIFVGQLDMDAFHRRFTEVSVHQIRMQTAPAVSSH